MGRRSQLGEPVRRDPIPDSQGARRRVAHRSRGRRRRMPHAAFPARSARDPRAGDGGRAPLGRAHPLVVARPPRRRFLHADPGARREPSRTRIGRRRPPGNPRRRVRRIRPGDSVRRRRSDRAPSPPSPRRACGTFPPRPWGSCGPTPGVVPHEPGRPRPDPSGGQVVEGNLIPLVGSSPDCPNFRAVSGSSSANSVAPRTARREPRGELRRPGPGAAPPAASGPLGRAPLGLRGSHRVGAAGVRLHRVPERPRPLRRTGPPPWHATDLHRAGPRSSRGP